VKSFTGTDIQGMASFLKDVLCGQAPKPINIEACSWTTISKDLDAVLRKAASLEFKGFLPTGVAQRIGNGR
jgi:hypothetical protein